MYACRMKPIEAGAKAVALVQNVPFPGVRQTKITRAVFATVSEEAVLEALRDSGDAFHGNGEELGTLETAILIEDAAVAIVKWLNQ